MKTSKPMLSIDKLVDEILRKNIVVEEKEKAKEILTRLNYQRLMAYRNKFLVSNNPEKYMVGTSFDKIYRLYKFDRELKFIFQKNIESIELMMRTLIAYNLGINYGDHAHLEESHFKNIRYHTEFKNIIFSKTDRSMLPHRKHKMVKHHHENYSDELPIYKAIELLTFGELSKFFLNLKDDKDDVDNKNLIVNKLRKLEHKLSNKVITSWLKTLVDIRNMCAHHELLYCRKFDLSPLRRKEWKGISVYKKSNKEIFSVYAIVLIFKNISLDREVFNETIESIKNLFEKYKDIINPKDIYFPENWEKDVIDK